MKGKILVVDDDPGIREMLKVILETDNQVSEAENGAALPRSTFAGAA